MTLSPNNDSSLTCDYQDDSFAVQCIKSLAFVFILLSSLIGNTLVIIIVYKRPELRNTINYFIVNMAVSDFVFPLTAIPEPLYLAAFLTAFADKRQELFEWGPSSQRRVTNRRSSFLSITGQVAGPKTTLTK